MRPVLFTIFGLDIQTYGVSKVLAAWVGALWLGRAFAARGLSSELAYPLVVWSTVWGFVGAKVYYLLEQLPNLTIHDFGGMGFTWYGGLVAGTVAALVMVRRQGLPLGTVAGAIAAPLSVAYAIGRLGCLIAGDGTYGQPTSLPWGMRFPNGVVATDVAVHPTPLYEALAALLIAAALWRLGRPVPGPAVFGWYLLLSGVARFLVEFLRINTAAVLGLTQPQLWAAASVLVGIALIARSSRRSGSTAPKLSTAPQSASATMSVFLGVGTVGHLDRILSTSQPRRHRASVDLETHWYPYPLPVPCIVVRRPSASGRAHCPRPSSATATSSRPDSPAERAEQGPCSSPPSRW